MVCAGRREFSSDSSLTSQRGWQSGRRGAISVVTGSRLGFHSSPRPRRRSAWPGLDNRTPQPCYGDFRRMTIDEPLRLDGHWHPGKVCLHVFAQWHLAGLAHGRHSIAPQGHCQHWLAIFPPVRQKVGHEFRRHDARASRLAERAPRCYLSREIGRRGPEGLPRPREHQSAIGQEPNKNPRRMRPRVVGVF